MPVVVLPDTGRNNPVFMMELLVQESIKRNGPVVVGGVGGSGTRVVVKILSTLGFFVGGDLSEAGDNYWHTMLLKRPRWYPKVRDDRRTIRVGLSLLSKLMVERGLLSFSELRFLLRATVAATYFGTDHFGQYRGIAWSLKRISKMLRDHARGGEYIGWGWKEPNSHLVVRDLNDLFNGFKYIHIVRNGLDMAFSTNQAQLYTWSNLFGVPRPRSSGEAPRLSLKYWIRANERAIRTGSELGPEKFLLLNYDELCIAPEQQIDKIIRFLNLEPTEEKYREILELPKKPVTFFRYQQHDLAQFDAEDLSSLLSLGFGIVKYAVKS
ncbi:MAG: sulfotransferase [Deltaproteobacteria bacterium]|nr:sulfotransferase [Deltaproteobacteria bacterium]